MCGLPIEPPRVSGSTYRQSPSTFSPMIPPWRRTSLTKSIQLMIHMLGPRWTIYIDTRFQRTLYLDTDIRVVADISEMFDILDRFDIAIAHAHARNRKETKTVWHFHIPDAFPQMNGGVLLFRSSPTVLDLLRAWQRAYHSAGFAKDQVTLRELLWLSDLRLHILPPEYNIRYERYLSFWEAREAIPRILHFRSITDITQESETYPKGGRN